jgi:hypothetical protein
MAAAIRFQKPKPLTTLRVSLVLSALLGAGALVQFQDQITLEGLILTSTNFRAGLYALYALVGALAVLSVVSWTRWAPGLLGALGGLQALVARLRIVALILFVALALILPVIALGFYGRFLLTTFTRLFLFWVFASVGAAL